jgi:hypothetical protein
LRYIEDFEMWLRLLAKHELARVDDVWVSYRVHDRNLSMTQVPRRRVTLENLAAIIRALREWPLDKLYKFQSPEGSAGHTAEEALALASIAERCLNLDKQYLGRPLLGASHAYMLAMDALLLDSQCAPARAILESSLEYMEGVLPGG